MAIKTSELTEQLKYYIEELEDLERSEKTIKNYYNSNKLFIDYLITNNTESVDNNNIK